jgi:hypothetical protein
MARWREKHSKAFREARHALLIETGERLVLVIIVAALAVGLLWLGGSHEMAISELFVRVATTAAILLAFPVVYAWKFVSFSAVGTWARAKLNLYLVIAAGFFAAAVIALGLYFWDQSRGPINWDWNVWWIGWSFSAGQPIRMSNFQIVGYNRWDNPIVIQNAYVRSDIDNRHIDLKLYLPRRAGLQPAESQVIPAKQQFTLTGPLVSDGDPMLAAQFRQVFGRSSFVFNSEIVRRFTNREID